MTTAAIAVAAILGAGVLAVALALIARTRTQSSDRLVGAVDEMRERMDELAHELADALDRAERESRRNRLAGELSASIDLDDLAHRLLDEALRVPGFDAALLAVDEPGRPPLVATRGMTTEEAAKPPTSGVTGGAPTSTITVSYRYGPGEEASELIRGGLFVPLVGREGAGVGTLALFWRRAGAEPDREVVAAVEELVTSAMPAIENARRYREARQLAETDALTGLFNQRYFHETLRREVLRAHRYGRTLALLVLDLDDFKAINDRIGHLAGDAVLAQVADGLSATVRSVDIACRIGGDEFAVILPESLTADAERLYRRLQEGLAGATFGSGGQKLRISGGIAELQHGDTAPGLFERADSALYRAKDLGKGRVHGTSSFGELPAP